MSFSHFETSKNSPRFSREKCSRQNSKSSFHNNNNNNDLEKLEFTWKGTFFTPPIWWHMEMENTLEIFGKSLLQNHRLELLKLRSEAMPEAPCRRLKCMVQGWSTKRMGFLSQIQEMRHGDCSEHEITKTTGWLHSSAWISWKLGVYKCLYFWSEMEVWSQPAVLMGCSASRGLASTSSPHILFSEK